MLAGLVQAEYVLRRMGQWQAADACADARTLLSSAPRLDHHMNERN